MTTCLGQSPKVNPAFTFDASSECQESISASQAASSSTDNGNCSDSSGDDENVVRKELKSRRQWKRVIPQLLKCSLSYKHIMKKERRLKKVKPSKGDER